MKSSYSSEVLHPIHPSDTAVIMSLSQETRNGQLHQRSTGPSTQVQASCIGPREKTFSLSGPRVLSFEATKQPLGTEVNGQHDQERTCEDVFRPRFSRQESFNGKGGDLKHRSRISSLSTGTGLDT